MCRRAGHRKQESQHQEHRVTAEDACHSRPAALTSIHSLSASRTASLVCHPCVLTTPPVGVNLALMASRVGQPWPKSPPQLTLDFSAHFCKGVITALWHGRDVMKMK